jgi:hypothetical protein
MPSHLSPPSQDGSAPAYASPPSPSIQDLNACFAPDYVGARARFLQAARAAGAAQACRVLPLQGRQGEELALDLARLGPADATRWLVVSSGCHGVEGFCGSGIQVAALRAGALQAAAQAADVSVLMLHALNPHGFSHLRRVTQENVDLNRNFADFSQPLPDNAGYRELHALLLPEAWPPSQANRQALADHIARHGMRAFQAAVSQGQHSLPDGMFFGGHAPTWSRRTLEEVLPGQMPQARHIAWVDLHTGLGPSGMAERIHCGPPGKAGLDLARAWWGQSGAVPVTSTDDGSSVSAPLTGLMVPALARLWPQALSTGVALEYGTRPLDEVMQALRADHWLYRHPDAPQAQRQAIGRQIRDAFYVDTDEWRTQVVAQALPVFHQAIEGLARA